MAGRKITKASLTYGFPSTHMISPLVSSDGDKEIVIVFVVTSTSTTWGSLGAGGPENKRKKVKMQKYFISEILSDDTKKKVIDKTGPLVI